MQGGHGAAAAPNDDLAAAVRTQPRVVSDSTAALVRAWVEAECNSLAAAGSTDGGFFSWRVESAPLRPPAGGVPLQPAELTGSTGPDEEALLSKCWAGLSEQCPLGSDAFSGLPDAVVQRVLCTLYEQVSRQALRIEVFVQVQPRPRPLHVVHRPHVRPPPPRTAVPVRFAVIMQVLSCIPDASRKLFESGALRQACAARRSPIDSTDYNILVRPHRGVGAGGCLQ